MLDADNRTKLRNQLGVQERMVLMPYTDTRGKLTIGFGRNLTDNGISAAEAFTLLDHDITAAETQTHLHFPQFDDLDPVRYAVVVNMVFNMGAGSLRYFTRFLAAVAAQDWDMAADEMLSSKWEAQVGVRAKVLAEQMRSGVWA